MRLLKKNTLATEIALQSKLQIDAGLTIARKVDALRDKLASLEEQERIFIRGTQDRLKEAITPLQVEYEGLKYDIGRLEEERAKLKAPLDHEWATLKMHRQGMEETKEKIARGLDRIKEREAEINSLKDDAKSRLSNIKVRERELASSYASAIEGDKAIKETLAKIENDKVIQDQYFKDKVQEFLEVEATLAVRQRELDMELASVKSEREDILTIKAQLADQRATLERALARLK